MIPTPEKCHLCERPVESELLLDVPFRKGESAALVYICILCTMRVVAAHNRFVNALASDHGVITHELTST